MLGLLIFAGAALPTLLPTTDCAKSQRDEIVVCGSRADEDEHFRLRPLPDTYSRDYVSLKLPGGAALTPKPENGRLGDVQAKVTLTVPF